MLPNVIAVEETAIFERACEFRSFGLARTRAIARFNFLAQRGRRASLPQSRTDPVGYADDIRAGILARLRARKLSAPGGIVSVDPYDIQSRPAMQIICKYPHGGGYSFWGMLFIHFRGQYCLVEAACKEGSPAGTREAALKPQLVREGKVRVRKAPFYKRPFSREATEYLDGWFRDPYDSSYRGAILCSVTDNEGFDSQFPLSRLRSILKSVRSTLRSADAPPSIR